MWQNIVEKTPPRLAALLFLLTLAMSLASTFISVDVFMYGESHRGFLFAPNWTISPLILGPLLLLVSWSSLRIFKHSVEQMRVAGMFRSGRQLEVVSNATINLRVSRLKTIISKSWLVLSGIAILECCAEWWFSCGRWVMGESLVAANTNRIEIDWSVANLVPGPITWQVAVFGFGAFLLLQGGILSAIALFLSTVFHCAMFVLKFALGEGNEKIVPAVSSIDRRRGFECLEDWGTSIFLGCIVLITIFYLTRLQNQFLHTPDASNWLVLITGPIADAIAEPDRWREVFAPGFTTDFSSNWTFIGAAVVFIVLIFIPIGMLTFIAKRSQGALIQLLTSNTELVENALAMSSLGISNSLAGMRFWPYHYVKINALLMVAAILMSALIWVALLPYILGLGIAAAVSWMVVKFLRGM